MVWIKTFLINNKFKKNNNYIENFHIHSFPIFSHFLLLQALVLLLPLVMRFWCTYSCAYVWDNERSCYAGRMLCELWITGSSSDEQQQQQQFKIKIEIVDIIKVSQNNQWMKAATKRVWLWGVLHLHRITFADKKDGGCCSRFYPFAVMKIDVRVRPLIKIEMKWKTLFWLLLETRNYSIGNIFNKKENPISPGIQSGIKFRNKEASENQ